MYSVLGHEVLNIGGMEGTEQSTKIKSLVCLLILVTLYL